MGIGSGGLIGSLGTGNLAIGSGALQYNVQGVDNVALGTDALKFCTTSYAVAIGPRALAALTSGAGNLAIGEAALQNLTTGADNTAIGRRALNSIQTSNSNVAIGASSLYSNTGQGNIGIGVEALYSNQTGQGNVAIGYGAARSGTLGTYNVAIGQNTLWSNLTGVNNVAIGLTAMYLCKSSYNVAIGDSALNVIDTGNGNIALGSESGLKLTTGEHNILIGWGCGKLTSIGEDNTALTQSILIGGNAYPLGLSETNEIVIGYEALGNGSNTITLGNSLATKLFTYAAITSPVPDGAAAVGTVIDTFESFATTGAKLLSIRNAGVEQAYMDKNALLVIGGNGSYGGVSVSSQYNPVMLRAENRASGSSTAGAFLGLFHNTLGGGSIMQSGHRMGGFFFGGNSGDDTNLRNSAGVFGFATETWVNLTGYGSAISFATTANGSTTRSEKMRLDHSGYLGLGVTSPTAALHVKSVTADGASAIATIIDTSVAWSTSGAKLVSFQNASAEKAYIDKDGLITSGGSPVGRKVAVPATAGATGSVGDWAADASWLYICTATNTWQRTAITLATW
jgi:hypothetical protein